ncbi:MAG: hypothetical protein A2636_01095 [Elusimicrobia bacterium RIFCSPHIGHO2_01_FULL_64_10]|nr:MAG: hypothetical protein A2636_01095 [Elusimicrobia bacterium RIFCSPHIGHO2_01_FULL_64_10]
MKKLLIPFQNIRFNIWLFAALALASILGTLVPQIPENPDRVKEFIAQSPKVGALLEPLGVFNIYYSWWFIGLLGLMAFDVVVCKIIFGRFPGMRTFKESELEPGIFSCLGFRDAWAEPAAPEESSGRIRETLSKQGYRVQTRSLPDGSRLVTGVRHSLQRFGSWVSHVSILIILLANLAGALWGFRETLNIPEGSFAKMEKRDWVVACDKFIVEKYPGTSTPMTFASDLRLFDGGKLVDERRILVNEPLEHKKVRFYQATYGPYLKEAHIGFFLKDKPKQSPTVVARLDQEVPVPGTPYRLRILEFAPDFTLNEENAPVSRSMEPENPAVLLQVLEGDKPVKTAWIFEKFPTMSMPPIEPTDKFVPVLAQYVPGHYTGLQIAYDPGATLFWAGCTILVLGLMVLFYMHERKIWVLVGKSNGQGCRVEAGGQSSRGKSFEREFTDLVGSLRGPGPV